MRFVIRVLPFSSVLWERILKRTDSQQLLGGVRRKPLHILAREGFLEGCSGRNVAAPAQAELSSPLLSRHFLLLGEVLFFKYDRQAVHGC